MHPTRFLRSSHRGKKPNITGFDISAFRRASGAPRYDPWERAEAWRYHGPFTRWNRFRGALPGLGTATVAFTAYCLYEHYFANDTHHGDAHGKDH